MMLRVATILDFEQIYSMCLKFLAQTEYKAFVDNTKVKDMVVEFLTAANEEKIVLIYEDKEKQKDAIGMIAGVAAEFPYGKNLVATELAWWVNPDHRKSSIGTELIEAFEFWAKHVGCSLITMSSLNDKLNKFYESKGYVLYERSFVKEI